ncbi:glycine cleavage system aminomethyltransferase GcvT [candidate division KSB1 bacterium]|nr:glycine cleavage system aminomethyltransferase GcvT [candidate division KSB1 bacterium]
MKKTALYEKHVQAGAKIVEFAGYFMPIQFRGIIDEHKRVRSTVGIFDVSHMGEFFVSGKGARDFVQKMTLNDVNKLFPGRAQYSGMCYEHGGMIDDLIVYQRENDYMLIVNAANRIKDWDWLHSHKTPDVELRDRSDELTLVAVQGPDAESTLQSLTSTDLSQIKFYHFTEDKLAGIPMIISRTGYTGEPGFELCFDTESSDIVYDAIIKAGDPFQIEPIGLGARDTLRLEMKYCLYGNDLDEKTNPLEAGLGWITKLDKGDFIGRDALLKVKTEGIRRKLIGFTMLERAFPRHGYVLAQNGHAIGVVTSGTVSPMLDRGIGMGYVPKELSSVGTELDVQVRNRTFRAQIVETPFYKK